MTHQSLKNFIIKTTKNDCFASIYCVDLALTKHIRDHGIIIETEMALKLVVLCVALAVCSSVVESKRNQDPPIGSDEDDGGGYDCPTCPEYGIFQAPDRTSCSRFIQCNNGLEAVHNCSVGMHFSIDRGICVDRAVANCDICRFNTEPVRFWPFEGSCTRYIVCFRTVRVERECASGFFFNPRIGQCDRPENVDCTPDTSHLPIIECPRNNQIEFLPSLHSCKSYFVCAAGRPSLHNCTRGLIFDIETNRCAPTGRCLLEYQPACTQHATFLPHIYECRHYFFCNEETPVLRACAPGLLFDIASLQCNLDTLATCAAPPRPTPPVWPNRKPEKKMIL